MVCLSLGSFLTISWSTVRFSARFVTLLFRSVLSTMMSRMSIVLPNIFIAEYCFLLATPIGSTVLLAPARRACAKCMAMVGAGLLLIFTKKFFLESKLSKMMDYRMCI